jgi:hypothetical protein
MASGRVELARPAVTAPALGAVQQVASHPTPPHPRLSPRDSSPSILLPPFRNMMF